MKTLVIYNPNAGSAPPPDEFREVLVAAGLPWRVEVTQSPDDARHLALQALSERYGQVVAAGGDGTVHQVANGLAAGLRAIRFGILPLGTGNDLARILGLPPDARRAVNCIAQGRTVELDLLEVHPSGADPRLALNVAVGGTTERWHQELDAQTKQSWGVLAYLGMAVRMASELEPYQVSLEWDGEESGPLDALGLIVANGRTAAGGFAVAPNADMEDGRADLVLLRPCQVADLVVLSGQMLLGDLTTSEVVLHRPVRRLTIRSTPVMPFTLDGEPYGETPLEVRVLPRAIRVVVGPDYPGSS